MKKNNKLTDRKQVSPGTENIKPLLPSGVVFALMSAWAFFVLLNYLKVFPFSLKYVDYFFFDLKFINTAEFYRNLAYFAYSISVAGSIFLSAFGLGIILLGKITGDTDTLKSEKILFSIVLGVGALALVILVLGLCGLYYTGVFILMLSVFSVNGLVQLYLLLKKPSVSPVPESRGPGIMELLCFCMIALIALVNIIGSLTPETFYDSQFYQLGILSKWKAEHRIIHSPYLSSTFFPFNMNMLYLVGIMLKNTLISKLAHFFAGAALCACLYLFSKKYFSRLTGILSVLIFSSIPIVMIVSWKTAVELGSGLFGIAAVFSLVNYFMNPEKRTWFIMSGIATGLAMGTKYINIVVVFLPIVLTLFCFGVIEKRGFRKIAGDLALYSAIAFLVYGPWWIKSIIYSGNPVYPFFCKKIGFLSLRENLNLPTEPSFPKFTFLNYFLFLWPLTMGVLQQESYPGAFFLVFLPLLFMFRNVAKPVKYLALYAVSSLFLWIIFCRFYLRLSVPMLAAFSIIFAYYINYSSNNTAIRNIFVALVMFLSLSNLLFVLPIFKSSQDPLKYVLGIFDKKTYLSTQRPSYPCPYYGAVDWANNNLGKGSKILFLGETRGLYSEVNFLTHGVADYVPVVEYCSQAKTGEELYAKLRSEGFTHVLFNVPEARRLAGYDMYYFSPAGLRVFCDFWNKHVREIYKACADVSLNDGRLGSGVPEFWNGYTSDPRSYAYIYEITENNPGKAPNNYFLIPDLYRKDRYTELESTIKTIIRTK